MDTEEVNSASTPLIISDGCCVHFGNAPALESVNFSIDKGKKVAVVGLMVAESQHYLTP